MIIQDRNHKFLQLTIACTLLAVLYGCAHAETPGERFGNAMAELKKRCDKTVDERPVNDTSCNILKLKPYDPLATEEGRFAQSIQLPPPHDKPKDVYKPGMTSEEYFKALCEVEAGEFIFKTVENVEGIFQMRPRELATDDMLKHLYAVEDPYGAMMEGDYVNSEFGYIGAGKYQFFESKVPPRKPSWPDNPCLKDMDDGYKNSGLPFWRYWGFVSWRWGTSPKLGDRICGTPMHAENEMLPKSLYGYTWRGISRPHDREKGIAGSEMIVLELATNKVLAVRRNYSKTGGVRNNLTGVWWMTAGSCPQVSTLVNNKLRKKTNLEFLVQVLKPSSVQLQNGKGDIK